MPAKNASNIILKPRNFLVFFTILIFCDLVAADIYNFVMQEREAYGRAVAERIQALERTAHVPTSYHHGLKPNVSVPALWGPLSYTLTTNSLGFRDSETRQIDLGSKNYRIVFMGDSFTYGMGFDYEKTCVGLVSKALKPKGIEVLNAAVPSYSPIIYWKKVEYLINKVGLKFDELVVLIDISDADDEVLYFLDDQGEVSEGRRLKPINADYVPPKPKPIYFFNGLRKFLKTNSILLRSVDEIKWRLFERTKFGFSFPHDSRSKWTIDDALYQEFGLKGLQNGREHMNELLKLCRAHGIKLTVAVYPWPDQLYYNDLNSKQVLFWQKWSEDNSVNFINYFPHFIIDGRSPRELFEAYFITKDVHWNESANQLVAQVFLNQFARPNKE